ncbi:MAG: polysaccharide pyruvyl transferase family protein [Acidobacteria bacterium]|nr:polysaccharide pyruvyl transferase family protein [Acidobacteriota bacterium]
MRVFVEPSGYRDRNAGDAAMLAVALRRLRERWPEAAITIHTQEPAAIARLDPQATPLAPDGSLGWNAEGHFDLLPDAFRALRRHAPRLMRFLAKIALRASHRNPRAIDAYLAAIRNADLVIVTGAGSLNDCFRQHASRVLETIELAIDSGAVTILMGQGLGPMSDPALRRRAAAVLPRVDFIALREGVASVALLQSMGVDAERMTVSGDDAIALAYAAHPPALGNTIGVNMRRSPYAGVDDAYLLAIGRALRARNAPLVAIPISTQPGEEDLATIRFLLGDSVEGSLERLPECRIVVAGSYHAAVMALAMGISVVTVARSPYYLDKFRGLAAQFGDGCRVVTSLDDLDAAIEAAWNEAPHVRASLLEAARRQIASSEAAYRHAFDLLETRGTMTARICS